VIWLVRDCGASLNFVANNDCVFASSASNLHFACFVPSSAVAAAFAASSSAIYELISPILPTVAYYKPFACDVSVPLPLLAACLRESFGMSFNASAAAAVGMQ
jgi:hypothetical protein